MLQRYFLLIKIIDKNGIAGERYTLCPTAEKHKDSEIDINSSALTLYSYFNNIIFFKFKKNEMINHKTIMQEKK